MNKIILNLTQHKATPEQVEAGVIDLPEKYRERLTRALTFTYAPDKYVIEDRVNAIINIVIDFCIDPDSPIRQEVLDMLDLAGLDTDAFKESFDFHFMIGGALWIIKPLVEKLMQIGTPVFAFSERVSEEKLQDDGSVVKVNVFKHRGFIEAI